MEIITPGKVQPPPPPWWIGQIICCRACGFQARLDEEDANDVTVDLQLVGKGYDAVAELRACPTHGCTGIPRVTRIQEAVGETAT